MLRSATQRLARPTRQLRSWWRRLSPARQDRVVTVAPLLSVLLFLAAIVTAFWYLRNEEAERETESLRRDTELVQQQIRLRMIENQELIVRLARDLGTRRTDSGYFATQSELIARGRPEIIAVSWIDPDLRIRNQYVPPDTQASLPALDDWLREPTGAFRAEVASTVRTERQARTPVYSRPYWLSPGFGVFNILMPVTEGPAMAGALVITYGYEALLRQALPVEASRRHVVTLMDSDDAVLAGSGPMQTGRADKKLTFTSGFIQPGHGVRLHVEGYRTSFGLIGNTLFWMVLALSVLTVWMLLGTWRHMRRRLQIQGALVQETNFRRAMENSMLTGMRAMDLDGRISYVNPAFCAMTGFSESELIGRLPPFPHWPPDRIEENSRLLKQELSGRSPPGGIEVRVMRKDGSQFDARMYVSPLIDAKGQQSGWMTSITNITEAKRVRDQLSASHERFTTVLEGLDASVSVIDVRTGELLFANRTYRLWFGGDASSHVRLAGGTIAPAALDADESVDGLGGLPTAEFTAAGVDSREIEITALAKWFDVRARYLQWTDGRLAQMLIATDITSRRKVEEQAAAQADRAQKTSRLVTMGEMASSVAHELNQPLTAISNYCNGMISRVKAGTISETDLLAALDKTARQAQRAGQIIHRIRSFVKKSEPQRQPSRAEEIVEDAVELAGIELRRRSVQLHVYVAQRLPVLMADPILIEQVLLNLLKNAAEAIDNARMPGPRRQMELRVVPRHDPELGGMIEFTVSDQGPGLDPEVLERLYESFFSTKSEGLGIGLSLCRSIVESHQGRIRAENLYNGPTVIGCRFTVTLPVSRAGEPAKQAEHS